MWDGHVTVEMADWITIEYGEVIERSLGHATELSTFLEKVTSLDSSTSEMSTKLATELEKIKVGVNK